MNNLGLPVEVSLIEKELAHLWENSGDLKTRASLINLAIYSEKKEDIDANVALIKEIAEEHPMRTLLIIADKKEKQQTVGAWITAHCYLQGRGREEICSEQISFLLNEKATDDLPGIVFSHLDSDLPLVFWRQGEFTLTVDPEFWSFVDRVIFDSHDWVHLKKQFSLVKKISELPGQALSQTVLCDLNWTRIFSLRKTLAGMFDCCTATPELWKIDHITIEYGKDYYATALLFLGWLSNQLQWNVVTPGSEASFRDTNGNIVSVILKTAEECSGIPRVHLQSRDAEFLMERLPQADHFHTEIRGTNIPKTIKTVKAAPDRLENILLAELARSGRHPLYHKAIEKIEAFF